MKAILLWIVAMTLLLVVTGVLVGANASDHGDATIYNLMIVLFIEAVLLVAWSLVIAVVFRFFPRHAKVRNYLLYIPIGLGALPLFVVPGCTQKSEFAGALKIQPVVQHLSSIQLGGKVEGEDYITQEIFSFNTSPKDFSDLVSQNGLVKAEGSSLSTALIKRTFSDKPRQSVEEQLGPQYEVYEGTWKENATRVVEQTLLSNKEHTRVILLMEERSIGGGVDTLDKK